MVNAAVRRLATRCQPRKRGGRATRTQCFTFSSNYHHKYQIFKQQNIRQLKLQIKGMFLKRYIKF